MKKQFIAAVALTVGLGFGAGNVLADTTFHFDDNWVNWPNRDDTIKVDSYYTPELTSMDVTISDSGSYSHR